MINIKKLFMEPKLIIWMLAVLIALVAIRPIPTLSDSGTVTFQTNLKNGIDIEGGSRALILLKDSSQDMAQKTKTILEKRIDAYGVKEKELRPVQIGDKWYVQLELAGTTEEELRSLIEKQGKFEAIIARNVTLINDSAVFTFNGKPYDLVYIPADDAVKIGNLTAKINGTIQLDGVPLEFSKKTGDSVTLSAIVISGNDVKQVFTDSQHSRVTPLGNGWQFEFSITISREAAERFAKVTSDLTTEFSNGQNYLSSDIDLYLDNGLVDSLKISSDLKGKEQPDIQISGPGSSRDDARKKMNSLQSILQSGALPTEIEVEQMNTISPSLGAQFMRIALMGIVFAIIAVSIVIFIRYRDPKIVIPIIVTSITEALLVLGIAGMIQWTIDLPAIAGLIASIGTGVNDQIIITDEIDKKREKEQLNMKRKIKNAFFIVFSAAATIVAAMIPLLTVGAGGVMGFAFTTIVGVFVGILITRPAYAKVLEYLHSGE